MKLLKTAEIRINSAEKDLSKDVPYSMQSCDIERFFHP